MEKNLYIDASHPNETRIVLKSDQGDDNADQHKLSIADGGTLTLASKISGSFVTYLTHTPNSTVASSTTARKTFVVKGTTSGTFEADEQIVQTSTGAVGKVVEYDSDRSLLYYQQERFSGFGTSEPSMFKAC